MPKDAMRERPKWPVAAAIAAGKAGLELTRANQSRLERRLPAGFVETLDSAVVKLEGKREVRTVAAVAQKAATHDQNAITAQGRAWLSAMREAVRRSAPRDAKLQKAFGVGEKVGAGRVASVIDAIGIVLKAAEAYPDRVQAMGILPSDIETGKALHSSIGGADTVQEAAKQTAKLSTDERDRARLVVENAVDRLIAVSRLEFQAEPEIAARFAALVPGRKRAAAKGTPASAKPA